MPVACKRLKIGGRLIITLVAALFLMGCLPTTECKEEVSSNISNEEIVVGTHPDADHIGGLAGICCYFCW